MLFTHSLTDIAIQIGWLAAVGISAAALVVLATRHVAHRVRLIEISCCALVLAAATTLAPAWPHVSLFAWQTAEARTSADIDVEPHSVEALVVPQPDTVAESATAPTVAAARIEKWQPTLQARSTAALAQLATWLPIVYLTGVALVLARWLCGLALVWRLRATAQPAPDAMQQIHFDVAGEAASGVSLLVSRRVAQPIACGLVRPCVILPAEWEANASAATLRAALAHEAAHIERGDLHRLHLVVLAQAVYWFHPAIWWLGRQLRLGHDLLADARAASQFATPEDYASILVRLASQALRPAPAMAVAYVGRPSAISRRVRSLVFNLNPVETHCGRAWTLACLTLAMTSATALAAVRLTDDEPQLQGSGSINIEVPVVQEVDKAIAQLPIGTIRHNPDGSLTFVGEVVDQDTKQPIEGAIVTIRQEAPTVPPSDRREVVTVSKHKTDARGRYHFNVSPDNAANQRLYMVCDDVTHEGYAPRGESGYSLAMMLKNRKLGEPPFFTRLKLKKGAEVTGQLQYADGRPAANVVIDGYNREGKFPNDYGTWLKTKTDDQGRFHLTMREQGSFFLRYYPAEAAAGRMVVIEPRRGDLGTIRLEPGRVIRGRLLDADGKPLADQWIEAAEKQSQYRVPAGRNVQGDKRERELLNGVYYSLRRGALTDAEGRFELEPLPPGKYELRPVEESASVHSDDRVSYPLKAVVPAKAVELAEGAEPVEVELRGVPSAEVVLQYVNGQGKPRSGWDLFMGGKYGDQMWSARMDADAKGRMVFRVPRGLDGATVRLMTSEHGSIRWSHGLDGEQHNTHTVTLGKVDNDVTDLVIHRYEAPIVLATVTSGGVKVSDVKVRGTYAKGRGTMPGVKGEWANGVPFDGDTAGPMMTAQPDGRYRSESMLPNEETTITAWATGPEGETLYGAAKLTLGEGEVREIEIEIVPSDEQP